jgi:hypothetical protein
VSESWTTTPGDRVTVFQRLGLFGSKWRYHITAANGELVEWGESYSRRIAAVRAAARQHPRVES